MTFLIKLARFGIFSTFVYGLFLIYIFCENIYSGNVAKHLHDIPLFTTNVSGIIGINYN